MLTSLSPVDSQVTNIKEKKPLQILDIFYGRSLLKNILFILLLLVEGESINNIISLIPLPKIHLKHRLWPEGIHK